MVYLHRIGIMRCPGCGHELTAGKNFCGNCGKKIETKKGFGNLITVLIIAGVLISLGYWYLHVTSMGGFAYSPLSAKIHVDQISGRQGLGETQVKFNIYNSGNLGAQNVYARVTLRDNKTLIKSERIYIGTLNPGDTKPISLVVNHPIILYKNPIIEVYPEY